MHEKSAAELNGLYSALFTPFDADNEIDFDALASLIRFQLKSGLSGFFVCGTTGEGLLLSNEERIELVRFVVEFCKTDEVARLHDSRVIAHVGHPSSAVAADLAREAAQAGADWIGAIGPVFYGNSFEGTVRHYSQIAQATELPFMIYAFQSAIDPERDVRLFEIPNVAGVKYTGADFFSMQQLARRLDRKIALISGMDELFVAGQSMGFQAGIGSTYNFMPEKFVEILRLCRANDFHAARGIQARLNQVIDYFCQFENWSFRKAFMRYIGLDCGPCRPPFEPVSAEQYLEFEQGLDELGILEKNSASP